jgi:hypothetical protein
MRRIRGDVQEALRVAAAARATVVTSAAWLLRLLR